MDRITHVCYIALLSVAVCNSPPVTAQPDSPPPRGPIPFAAFDQNNDGRISESEFNAMRAQRRSENARSGRPMRGAADAPTFDELDADGDGQLTAED